MLENHRKCKNLQDMNLAATYSESPSPSQSVKGSFTSLGAESARDSRGNKENEGGDRRSKAGSDSKYLEKQHHVLLGETALAPPPPPRPPHTLSLSFTCPLLPKQGSTARQHPGGIASEGAKPLSNTPANPLKLCSLAARVCGHHNFCNTLVHMFLF